MIEGLNLHATVADALAELNPWQELTFTKKTVEWSPSSRTPKETTATIVLNGKIQPADTQEVQQLGFDVTSFQYYRIFISAGITQIDELRQLGADEFTTENGDKYKVVAKSDWIQNGWREGYAYLMDVAHPSPEPEPEGKEDNETV